MYWYVTDAIATRPIPLIKEDTRCDRIDGALREFYSGGNHAFPTTNNPTDLTARLLTCGVFADSPRNVAGDAPPRIPTRTLHYRFALYVLAGYPYEEACRVLAINPRTAERWRTELRRTASRYFGRPVTYEFAARYALDPALRHACERQVRETPQ